jgi:hypothetical protein
MLKNKFEFSGEIVRSTPFDNGGGNAIVRGYSKAKDNFGHSEMELSLFFAPELWSNLTKAPYKYKLVTFEGHMEVFVHYTKNLNKKENVKFICDSFKWINNSVCLKNAGNL